MRNFNIYVSAIHKKFRVPREISIHKGKDKKEKKSHTIMLHGCDCLAFRQHCIKKGPDFVV